MRTELNLMSHLDVMLSMDSANMHLASPGQYSGCLYLGSHPSLCRFYGLETIAGQYRATRFVMPSLFCIWSEALLAR